MLSLETDHPSAMLGRYTLTTRRYLSLPWNEEINQPLSSTFLQRRLQARIDKQQFSLLVACLWASEPVKSHLGAPTMLSNPLYAPVGVTATQRSGKRKKWKILQFSSKIQATPLNHHLTSFPHLFHPKTHPKHSSTRYYYCCSAALVVSQLLQVENSCHRPCG
jgi:hypothetical protein